MSSSPEQTQSPSEETQSPHIENFLATVLRLIIGFGAFHCLSLLWKKVCLLLSQLLLEMIYTITERNVVLVLHARFLKPRTCSFCAKPYHERDRCPARNAICYSCKKRGHFSRACRSRLGSQCSKLSTFSASVSPSLCIATAACPGDLIKASIPVIVGGKVFTALIDSGSSESCIHSSICGKLNLAYLSSHLGSNGIYFSEGDVIGILLT